MLPPVRHVQVALRVHGEAGRLQLRLASLVVLQLFDRKPPPQVPNTWFAV